MKKIFTALCLLGCFTALCQTTYFVKVNATGANNGTSWEDAFISLQNALAAAANGSQIWVAAGTYYPDEGEGLSDNNQFHSFQLKSGVAIYGGFAGTETLLRERNVTSNVTVLSGEIQQDNDNFNNAFHVVRSEAVDKTAVLDGFTITAGNAIFDLSRGSLGGGMYNVSSSPKVVNCSFVKNTAFGGGGMHNNSSSPSLTNCSFIENTAETGGGMSNENSSSPKLVNCSFIKNTAFGGGGGMYNNSSSPSLTNCSFIENTAETGGGIVNDFSTSTLTECSFSANRANTAGGGIFNVDSSPSLVNCSFSANIAPGGGGIFNGNSSPGLINCSFLKNKADFNGGGIYNVISSPTLTNCSFSVNSADFIGGGIYNDHSFPTLINCIVWGNSVGEIVNEEGSSADVTYSIVQGGYPGTGNLDQDPLFVNAANGDLHLRKSSAAIDAGLNSANPTSIDLDGKPRIINGIIDMGAYEFQNEGIMVSSLTLVNADTDKDIRELKEGDVIDLATPPPGQLNIRATTDPDSVGSIVFHLQGPLTRTHTENLLPYALFGDDTRGGYYGATLPVGDYTLTATPYSGSNGTGTKGTPLTIRFKVVYSATVVHYTLVNADTDKDIGELKDGAVIDLTMLPPGTKLNVRANTLPSRVGSVAFQLDGALERKHIENTAPYALFANDKQNYFPWSPQVGNYTLTATPRSNTGGGGAEGRPLTIRFSIIYSATVSSFTLVNASTNLDGPELVDGSDINLSDYPVSNLTIRANTTPDRVGSVVFNLEGPRTHTQTENLLPYALFGDDTKGGYYGDGLPPGDYYLTATPYTGVRGTGAKGIEKRIYFRVVPVRPQSTVQQDVKSKVANMQPEKAGDREEVRLYPNAPNPFGSATTISFELAKAGQVQLTILNSQGSMVESLLNKFIPAGKHNLIWQAKHLSSGVYIVQLRVGNVVKTQRMIHTR